MAQLRAGHCSSLRGYISVVDPTGDPTCPRCGDGPEDVSHWLRDCAATERIRQEEFGGRPPLGVLAWDQPAARAFALRTIARR